MKTQTFTIMVGNVATGKTGWLRKYLQRKENKETVVLSKDAIRWMLGGGNKYCWSDSIEPHVHNAITNSLRYLLTAGVSVIYDETNMSAETRQPFIRGAQDIFASMPRDIRRDIKAVVMPFTTVDTAMDRRCGELKEAWGYDESIWREVWHRKNKLYEPPTYNEGFSSIVVVEGF